MTAGEEIDFITLRPNRFEELCYDVLAENNFQNLVWRQGGADSGRDIQGTRRVMTGVVSDFDEVWFFECKRYEGGVPPETLHSKIAWADAELPNHLVFFVSSYITNPAREWLSKINKTKPYRIHLIEGEQLKRIITNSDFLLGKYFLTELQRLLRKAYRSWAEEGFIPEVYRLRELQPQDRDWFYSHGELTFLWNCNQFRRQKIETATEYDDALSTDAQFMSLAKISNCTGPILNSLKIKRCVSSKSYTSIAEYWAKSYCAEIWIDGPNGEEQRAFYTFVRDSEGEGIEAVSIGDMHMTYYIRHVPNDASQAQSEARQMIDTVSCKPTA